MAVEEYIPLEQLPDNWPGVWHELAKKRGINNLITSFKLDLNSKEIEKIYHVPHQKIDAIGNFAYLFKREENIEITPPVNQKITPPSFWQGIKIFIAFIKSNRHSEKVIPWNKPAEELKSEENTAEYLYSIFTREETEAIKNHCKENHYSLTSKALEIVNRICSKKFIKRDGVYRWMMPVNLRGHIDSPHPLSNQAAAISINIDRQALAPEIQKQTKEKLKAGFFWPVWWSLNIGKYIRTKGMKLIANLFGESSFYMGNISNLGEWTTNDSSKAYCYYPPGRSNFPISFSMMTINNQLIMTARFHPFIADDSEFEQSVFDEIIQEIKAKTI